MDKKKFVIEEHPLLGCILYLVTTFFAQYFINNAFYAMCVVDLFFYLYVFIRRTKSSLKKSQYASKTWVINAITITVLIITTYCWSRWYMSTVADNSSIKYANEMSNVNIKLYLFMISIAAPLGEESLFRYIVLNGFFNKFKNMKKPVQYAASIFLSSLLFAVMHGTGVHLLIGCFCGMALSIAYFTTGRLWVSILLHSAYNLGTLFVRVPLSLQLCAVLTILSIAFVTISVYNLSCKHIE